MINKTINLQKQISIGEGIEKRNIAFLNAQISEGYGVLNMSIQIMDKEALNENDEYVRSEIEDFKNQVVNEAVISGWDLLKIN